MTALQSSIIIMGKLDVVGSNLANLLLGEIKVEPIDLIEPIDP
jgi:hypothetical protein